MAEKFVVHCRPTDPTSFDYRCIDEILGSDLADLQPRLLEPGVWLLEGDGDRWARHILQTLTMRLAEQRTDGDLSMRVRSLIDPLDDARWPASAGESDGELDQVLVRHSIFRG